MALNLLHKYSLSAGNVPSSLLDGEIAINQADKKLFYKSGSSVLSKTLLAEGDVFSAGLAGGQTINGGNASGNTLTLKSTSNATKGKILFGTSAYDEVNNILLLGATSITNAGGSLTTAGDIYLDSTGSTSTTPRIIGFKNTGVGTKLRYDFDGGFSGLQAGNAALTQIYGYWGIRLEGMRVAAAPAFISQSGAAYPDVNIIRGTGTTTILSLEGKAAQAVDFLQVRSLSTASTGDLLTINKSGYIGVNVSLPTAKIHIAAGTATANTAPLKLTAGTNLTTPEAGSFEFDGTNLYFTIGTTRKTVTLT